MRKAEHIKQILSVVFQKPEVAVGDDKSRTSDARTLSMESIQRELDNHLSSKGKGSDNETVFDWIEVYTCQQSKGTNNVLNLEISSKCYSSTHFNFNCAIFDTFSSNTQVPYVSVSF